MHMSFRRPNGSCRKCLFWNHLSHSLHRCSSSSCRCAVPLAVSIIPPAPQSEPPHCPVAVVAQGLRCRKRWNTNCKCWACTLHRPGRNTRQPWISVQEGQKITACCSCRPAPGAQVGTRLPCELPSTEQPNASAAAPALAPFQELPPCSQRPRGRAAAVRALLAAAGAAGGRAACMAPALCLAPGARICSSPWVVCERSS